jgi:hypothetical protein
VGGRKGPVPRTGRGLDHPVLFRRVPNCRNNFLLGGRSIENADDSFFNPRLVSTAEVKLKGRFVGDVALLDQEATGEVNRLDGFPGQRVQVNA